MIKHIIEFEAPESVHTPSPWPITLDHDGYAATGMGPDLDGTALLVGFGPAGEQTITVFTADAIKNPESVVGMTPTFSDGNLFVWNIPVREFRTIEEH